MKSGNGNSYENGQKCGLYRKKLTFYNLLMTFESQSSFFGIFHKRCRECLLAGNSNASSVQSFDESVLALDILFQIYAWQEILAPFYVSCNVYSLVIQQFDTLQQEELTECDTIPMNISVEIMALDPLKRITYDGQFVVLMG
ncbi:hypothetical protein RF11_09902 [Thelohanellus kitauei]|uniref:Uncharacterized protein n=1 Tax=Thelohanellus kitauei TaxID=669202 RepID=A0A0C2NBF7_THEKT|nr:hypothetical protein RF11_09902 [Thelohanellus kitauei]